MNQQYGQFGEYQGYNRLQLIQQVRMRRLGSPAVNPGTDNPRDNVNIGYPKQDIIDKLNEAQTLFVRETECLSTFGIIEAVANQSMYKMPRRCLKITGAKWYNSASNYYELEIIPDMSYMQRISNTYRVDPSGTCEYLYHGYNHGHIKTFGIYPKPGSNGTAFVGSSVGLITESMDFTFTGEVQGSHSSAYTTSSSFIDAQGRNFVVMGIKVGMMIYNETDGSSGQITSISNKDAVNDQIAVTLSGGTNNKFNPGDTMTIAMGQYGVVIRGTGKEEYAFNATLGMMEDINPAAGNFLIDFVMRPLALDRDNQYPEIPPDFHQCLVDYAVWKLWRNDPGMAAVAADAKQSWVDAINNFKNFARVDVESENTVEDRTKELYG